MSPYAQDAIIGLQSGRPRTICPDDFTYQTSPAWGYSVVGLVRGCSESVCCGRRPPGVLGYFVTARRSEGAKLFELGLREYLVGYLSHIASIIILSRSSQTSFNSNVYRRTFNLQTQNKIPRSKLTGQSLTSEPIRLLIT